jgi:hypothetical protein
MQAAAFSCEPTHGGLAFFHAGKTTQFIFSCYPMDSG